MVNRRSWLDLAAGTGLVVTWSSGFIGAELGTREAPPDTLLLWRYVAATGLLAFVLCLVQARPRRHGLRRQAAIGLLCQGVYVGGVVTGVALGVPAGTAALLAAMQPLVVAVFASRLLGQRTSRVQAAGLFLGLVGVGVVVAGDLGTGGGPAWIFLLPLVGMLGLSVGTVLERHWRLSDSLLQSLTVQSATVTVLLVVESTLAGHVTTPDDRGLLARRRLGGRTVDVRRVRLLLPRAPAQWADAGQHAALPDATVHPALGGPDARPAAGTARLPGDGHLRGGGDHRPPTQRRVD